MAASTLSPSLAAGCRPLTADCAQASASASLLFALLFSLALGALLGDVECFLGVDRRHQLGNGVCLRLHNEGQLHR